MQKKTPDFLLFGQHGWADTSQEIGKLSKILATPNTHIITPDLGWFNTWLRIEPLIENVEQIALNRINQHPEIPVRIIGHSMGGLIWLEVLNRNPEWWSKIGSLTLVASPVGGADLGRLIDPLGFGIGIARDLGINRRPIAEKIAQVIPTLTIAGDIDGGSDGTITVQSTKFAHAKFISLPGLNHAVLKNHPQVSFNIRNFWSNSQEQFPIIIQPDFNTSIIQRLQSIEGMTDAHRRDFYRSQEYIRLNNGLSIRLWKSPLQIDHVFVADSQGECLYGGFVGWNHALDLYKTLEVIKKEFTHN